MPEQSVTQYVDRRLRTYARGALVAFVILLAAFGYSISEAGRSTRLNSKLICGIVLRLDQANQMSFEQGKITLAQRQEARNVYSFLRESSEINCNKSTLPIETTAKP